MLLLQLQIRTSMLKHVYFLAAILRIRPASSSLFRLPRRWVPSCKHGTKKVFIGLLRPHGTDGLRTMPCLPR